MYLRTEHLPTIRKEGIGMRVPPRYWLSFGLLFLSGGLALGLLFAWGCGVPEPSVAGTIRLDGKPLSWGSIDFFPENGLGPTAGVAIERGQYRIPKGLKVGKYRVAIQSTRRRPDKMKQDPLGGVIPAEEAIKFAFKSESDRIRQIGPGLNTHDFDLKETSAAQPRSIPRAGLKRTVP
jgi:hypothetical protein